MSLNSFDTPVDTPEISENSPLDEKIDYAVRLLVKQHKLKQRLIHSFPDLFKVVINRTRRFAQENKEADRALSVEDLQLVIINFTQRLEFEIFGEEEESPYEEIDRLRKSLDSFKTQLDLRTMESITLLTEVRKRDQDILSLRRKIERLTKPPSDSELVKQINGLNSSLEGLLSENEKLRGVVASQRLLLERIEARSKKNETKEDQSEVVLSAAEWIQNVHLQDKLAEILDELNRLEVTEARLIQLSHDPDLTFAEDEFEG